MSVVDKTTNQTRLIEMAPHILEYVQRRLAAAGVQLEVEDVRSAKPRGATQLNFHRMLKLPKD